MWGFEMTDAENLVYFRKEDGEWDREIVRNDFLIRFDSMPNFPCNKCLIKMICKQKSNCPFRVDFIRAKVNEWRWKEHEDYIKESRRFKRRN